MNRRDVLRTLALALGGAGALAGSAARAFSPPPGRARWRLALDWPPELDLYAAGAFRFVRQVSLLTESRLALDARVAPEGAAPGGAAALVLAGEADCAHLCASALADRVPALEWFAGVPFGLDSRGLGIWLYRMGGLALLREALLPLGLYGWPLGDAGPGVFAWSRRPLADSGPDALAGLALTARGLAAEVLGRAGARVSAAPSGGGAALARALERGELDCAAWHGAHHEAAAGLPGVAPHGLGPGWQAPGRRMLLVVRREAYEALPAVVRKIFAAAVVQADHELTLAVAAANARALAALAAAGRTVAPLPPALVGRLRALSGAVAAEGAGADALVARVRAGHDAALHAVQALGPVLTP